MFRWKNIDDCFFLSKERCAEPTEIMLHCIVYSRKQLVYGSNPSRPSKSILNGPYFNELFSGKKFNTFPKKFH